MKKRKPTDTEVLKEAFDFKCKKCNSDKVYVNYQQEGGYSEYTQWGSSVSFGCAECHQNDIFLVGD